MNKIFKIIILNIIFFISLLLISDIIFYTYQNAKGMNNSPHYKFGYTLKKPYLSGFETKNFFNGDYHKHNGRLPDGLKYKNQTPIVIFGCSYAFGQDLETPQTFSYKLANSLKKPVYNRAFPGAGFQHMYFQTVDKGSESFFNEVPPSDTVIYVMMDNHYQRLIRYSYFNIFRHCFYPIYHIKNNNFVLNNYTNPILNLFKSSYTIKYLNGIYTDWYIKQPSHKDKLINMIVLYCVKTKESLEKHWNKKINFIVIYYPSIRYDKFLLKKLKDNGIIVIDIRKLTTENLDTNPKYLLPDKHPNEAAWDLITPLVINELKKKNIL